MKLFIKWAEIEVENESAAMELICTLEDKLKEDGYEINWDWEVRED